MQSVRGLSIVLGSSWGGLFAVGAVVISQELVAEVLKVAVTMGQKELTGLPKAD